MTETTQRSVKNSDIKRDFKYEVSRIHGGDKLLNCFQCGTCTSDCPIARFSDTYRPRQIIRMAQIGLREQVLSSDSLWLCASCFTCTDRCPQDVEVASVIRVLRNLAAQQAFVPQVFKQLGTTILETGYAYRIPELRLKKREDLGLPPLPKSNQETLNTILGNVQFQKIIGKNR
jgi:heterodisulfide reductase subunit C